MNVKGKTPLTNEEAAQVAGGESGRYISIDTARCIGCGECRNVCPLGAIEMVDGKPQLFDSECVGCASCAGVCPTSAITVL